MKELLMKELLAWWKEAGAAAGSTRLQVAVGVITTILTTVPDTYAGERGIAVAIIGAVVIWAYTKRPPEPPTVEAEKRNTAAAPQPPVS